MEYKPSNVLIKQQQSGTWSYEIQREQDKRRSFYKANIHILGNQSRLSCLPMEERDYKRHMEFSDVDKWNTLEIKYFDKATSIALVENINFTLDQWLHTMLIKGSNDDKREDRISYYVENPKKWFDDIEADFKNIFGPITDGLRSLHYHGKYHGNLNEGIVISKNAKSAKGLLFNMKDRSDSAQAVRKEDVLNLIELIQHALKYPFNRATSLQLMSGVQIYLWSEIHELSLQQLKDRVSNYMNSKSLRAQWDLNPMILWDDGQMVNFLDAMHWVLYRGNCKHVHTIVKGAFVSDDWGERVKQKNIPNLTDALSKTKNVTENMSKLAFWRNCMAHMISINV